MANDHYVPQFYLRNFKIEKVSKLIQNNSIYCYKRNGSRFNKSIKSVACKDDYYNLTEENYIEHSLNHNKILSTFENHTPKILRRIIDNIDLTLSQNEQWTLSYFIATLSIRNPSVHKFLAKQIIDERKSFLVRLASKKQSFYEEMKKIEPTVTDEEIEITRNCFLEFDRNLILTLPDYEHNKSYLRSLIATPQYVILARRLFFYNWHLLAINTDNFFVTSDNPVCFLSPRLKDELSLWQCPVFLPINPKLALLIHPFSFYEKTILIDDELIDFYIKQSVIYANELVFSHTDSEIIQNVFNKTKHNLKLNYQYNFLPERKLKLLIENGIIKI